MKKANTQMMLKKFIIRYKLRKEIIIYLILMYNKNYFILYNYYGTRKKGKFIYSCYTDR